MALKAMMLSSFGVWMGPSWMVSAVAIVIEGWFDFVFLSVGIISVVR